MKKLIFLLFIILFFQGCAIQQEPAQSDSVLQTTAPVVTVPPTTIPVTEPTEPPAEYLNVEPGAYLLRYEDPVTGNYLDYYCFIPENAVKDLPLIIFLHGDGEVNNPEALAEYWPIQCARNVYGEDFPFLLISPCTRIPSWTDGNIPETLMGLIENVSDTYFIDKSRTIISGHSRGALGVWHMLGLYGDYFSAAMPISCGPNTQVDYTVAAQVPVTALCGTVGEYENYYLKAMEAAVSKLLDEGGNAQMIYLDGLDHAETCEAAFSREMFEWMLTQ